MKNFVVQLRVSSLASLLSALVFSGSLQATDPSSTLNGFQSLFNGNDLNGWKHSGNWKVADGMIARQGSGGSLVYQARSIPDDFELRFEWKVASGSNSGVYYRPGQYEYQILDNEKHRDGKNPRTSAASLYFCMPPSHDATKPVGSWNEGRIVCKGSVIQHWLNGQPVVSFDYTNPKWKAEVDLLRRRGGDLTKRGGKLSLQDHGDPVWYRNIQLRSIPEQEKIEAHGIQPADIDAATRAAELKKLEGIEKRRKN